MLRAKERELERLAKALEAAGGASAAELRDLKEGISRLEVELAAVGGNRRPWYLVLRKSIHSSTSASVDGVESVDALFAQAPPHTCTPPGRQGPRRWQWRHRAGPRMRRWPGLASY